MKPIVLKPPDRIITGPVAIALDLWTRLLRKPAFLGDGSDGRAVLDGKHDVAWAERDGNVYRMTRTCQVRSLVVCEHVMLITAGWQICSRGPVFGTVYLHEADRAAR
jgi:hypothetical protein